MLGTEFKSPNYCVIYVCIIFICVYQLLGGLRVRAKFTSQVSSALEKSMCLKLYLDQ